MCACANKGEKDVEPKTCCAQGFVSALIWWVLHVRGICISGGSFCFLPCFAACECASASYMCLDRNNALPSSEHSKVSWVSYCWNCGSRSRCYGKGVSSNHFWLHRVSCELFKGVACETTCPWASVWGLEGSVQLDPKDSECYNTLPPRHKVDHM